MVGKVRRRSVLVVVGGLAVFLAVLSALVGLLAVDPASAYKGKAPIRITSATLTRIAGGVCYVTVTWDKSAGRPRYYMFEWETAPSLDPSGGVVGGAMSITEPRKLTSAQVKEARLVLGPFPDAEVASCRVALAPGLDGKTASWVWTNLIR